VPPDLTVTEPLSAGTIVATGALFATVLAPFGPRWAWITAGIGTVVAGYVAGAMHGPAALWLLVLGVSAARAHRTADVSRALWLAATVVFSLLLGLHLLPGFTNPIVLREVVLSDGARPYSQYINFDKTLGAVLLLGSGGFAPLRSAASWRDALARTLPILSGTMVVAMAASLALGFVRVDPRWTSLFLVWAPINLLFTCVSEEAFFRGLIQKELTHAITRRGAHVLTVAISALLFGLAHAAGGWRYVILATLAGIGYALAYQRTQRLEMAILTHFTVNAVHFLFFTYPWLV
jgi:uncharacterized protein